MKKILMIGNSFTYFYDVPLHFELLALKAGKEVQVEYAVKGGETFQHGADFGTVYGKMVQEKLYGNAKFDRIILQEQSHRPITNRDAFLDGLAGLLTKIHESQPQAEVVLYATWGYADDYEKWSEIPCDIALNHDLMTKMLHDAYKEAGEKFGLPVVYVGDVFHKVYREYGLDPFYTDRKHPSYLGTMCTALSHFVAAFPDVKREELPAQHVPHVSDYEQMLDAVFEVVRGDAPRA